MFIELLLGLRDDAVIIQVHQILLQVGLNVIVTVSEILRTREDQPAHALYESYVLGGLLFFPGFLSLLARRGQTGIPGRV
jgi:hypothetical protein